MRVCAITMVYNEFFSLPVWLRHYGRQVGAQNLIVLDNGSDDGSTADLGAAGHILLPRGAAFNEAHRMKLITELANNLLNYFDAVIYTDCDEMLVADPAYYADLSDYCEQMTLPVAHAIGLNIRQNIKSEGSLDLSQPILRQRRCVQFVSPMCKPLIIRKPVSWGGGFHCCEHMPTYGHLYLFHLRHADLEFSLRRLAITREITFARAGAATHQKQDFVEMVKRSFGNVHNLSIREDWDFSELLAAAIANTKLSFTERYHISPRVQSNYLFRVPERFSWVV
ncbi:MAG: glycosyltransferase family 2 protein [Geminicoccaceae bacterium]